MKDEEKMILEFDKKRMEKKHKDEKVAKVQVKVMIVLMILVACALVGLIAYLIATKDVRAQNSFSKRISAVQSVVMTENLKKEDDPNYKFIGIPAEERRSIYKIEYSQIEEEFNGEITEDFYVLEQDQLAKLGINTVLYSYLVDYSQNAVFALEPLNINGEIRYTTDDVLAGMEIKIYIDKSGANKPQVEAGMKPVIYDDKTKNWIFVENPEETAWYNYDRKIWANVMLSDTTEGNVDGSQFVWIPRFAYKISNANWNMQKAGVIEIKFLVDDTNVAVDGTTINDKNIDSSKDYVVHPAFNFGKQVKGIWISKYEASTKEFGSDAENGTGGDNMEATYRSAADKYSWTNLSTDTAYLVAKNIKFNPVYGLDANVSNTHLIKNTEWSAVAYLTQSKYGRNGNEVTINNYYEKGKVKTGYAGRYPTDPLYGTSSDSTFAWDTVKGVKASTTSNVYGIYDLSGGAVERVAAYISNGSKNLSVAASEMVDDENYKYKDIYTIGDEDSQLANFEATRNKPGAAMFETSSNGNGKMGWFYDYSYMPCQDYPLFYRGGNATNGQDAGLYYYGSSSGGGYGLGGFRASIIIE